MLRSLFMVFVFILAIFGAYTLYNQNEKDIKTEYSKVEKKLKKINKVIGE